MNFSGTSLKGAQFTHFFIQKNGINNHGFKEWAFYPGMLFHSQDKWWGNQGQRARPHEGLDLCFYRDRDNKIFHIGQKSKIPAIFDGIVVRIIDDFLGQSIFVEHRLHGFDTDRLYTIYGHTIPDADLSKGTAVKQGDIIATIAGSNKSNTNVRPHLHISLGWSSEMISYDQLDWEAISNKGALTLLDPLEIMDGEYSIMEGNEIDT